MNAHKILIIGVGNAWRGDDAAGLLVARRLRARGWAHVAIVEQRGDGAALLEAWRDAGAVIVIDAVNAGSVPGTIHRLDAGTEPIPARFFHYSTHAFGVAEALELARALKQLPPRVIVYGIEGQVWRIGASLSPEVERSIPEVAARVAREVERGLGPQ